MPVTITLNERLVAQSQGQALLESDDEYQGASTLEESTEALAAVERFASLFKVKQAASLLWSELRYDHLDSLFSYLNLRIKRLHKKQQASSLFYF